MTTPRQQIRNLITRLSDPWLDTQPAWLGDAEGVVTTSVAGVYNARLINAKVVQVYNQARVPADYDLPVLIGRNRATPTIWQIIEARQSYTVPVSANRVEYHHEQHEEEGADRLSLDRKQIRQLTVRVLDGSAFTVTVFGDYFPTKSGIRQIDHTTLDLLPYQITAEEGAKFVAIEATETGALSVQEGAIYQSPGAATYLDIPSPGVGKYHIASVLLFGQSVLLDSHIHVPMPISFNPRVLPTELVMEDGVTFPPVPITNEDGTDWVYAG